MERNIPSSKAYVKAIQSGCLTRQQLKAIQILYEFPEHAATANQVTSVLGYKGSTAANLMIASAGKDLATALNTRPPAASEEAPNWWSMVAEGDGTASHFRWIMHQELAEALRALGLVNGHAPKK